MSVLTPKGTLDVAALAYAIGDSGFPPEHLIPEGFSLADDFFPNGIFEHPDTGLKMLIINDQNGNYVVSFAGSEDSQDLFVDINLGWPQWEAGREEVLAYLAEITPLANSIRFAGHSMGGALAQYAAFDYGSELKQTGINVDIGLITFNSLGGVAGLKQNVSSIGKAYDPNLLTQFDNNIFHYVVNGDFVSRFGEGHLGGQTYLVETLDSLKRPYDLVTAHRIDTMRDLGVTYDGFDTAMPFEPDYLYVSNLQHIAAGIGNFLNIQGQEFDPLESEVRLLAAVIGGVLLASTKIDFNASVIPFPLPLPSPLPGAEDNEFALTLPDLSRELETFIRELLLNAAHSVPHNGSPGLTDAKRQLLESLAEVPWSTVLGKMSKPVTSTALVVTGVGLLFAALADVGQIAMNQVESLLGSQPALAGLVPLLAPQSLLDAWRGEYTISSAVKLVLSLFGDPETIPALSLTSASIDEQGQGIISLSASEILMEPTDVVLRVSRPDLVTLDGLGVTQLGEPDEGKYLVKMLAGEVAKQITVISPGADDNVRDDDVVVEVVGTPLSELDDAFVGATLTAGTLHLRDLFNPEGMPSITGTENDDQPLEGTGIGEQIYGLGGDDDIVGGFGEDRIFGGQGADVINGGEDGDFISGDDQKDVLFGGNGDDELRGGMEQDFLSGSFGADRLVGDDGADVLAGGAEGDTLIGGDGDDFLFGDASYAAQDRDWTISETPVTVGNLVVNQIEFTGVDGFFSSFSAARDQLFGGAGDDQIFGAGGNDFAFGEADNDFVVGNAGDDFLDGGTGDDVIHGDDRLDTAVTGDDELFGDLGNDVLVGGNGKDELHGGDGADLLMGDDLEHPDLGDDDRLYGDAGEDELQGGRGADILYGGPDDDFLVGDYDHADPEAFGDDYLSGGDGRDLLVGGGGADTLYGGEGDDELHGDSSAIDAALHRTDILYGDAGNDELRGYGGNDRLYGGTEADLLIGGEGDDLLLGEAGDDILDGGNGGDQLRGGDGNDHLQSGAGDDVLNGNAGNDVLLGEAGDDLLSGGAGDDDLRGYAGDDYLDAGTGNDIALGGEGDDVIDVGGGDDYVDGGDGNDLIFAGKGVDDLAGGPGNDQYIYNAADGDDAISDSGGDEDRIIFGTGIDTDSMSFNRQGDTLVIRFGTANPLSDRLTIVDWFLPDSTVEQFEFAGADSWGVDEIKSRVVEDYLLEQGEIVTGSSGDTTYRIPTGLTPGFSLGMADAGGADRLLFETQQITVPSGFPPAFVTPKLQLLSRDGDDLLLNVLMDSDLQGGDAQGTVRIEKYFLDDGWVETIEFPDQTLNVPNSAPTVATTLADQVIDLGILYELRIPNGMFQDDLIDVLSFSAQLTDGSPLPAWLNFDPAMRTFSGMPSDSDAGVLEIEVMATDRGGASSSSSFSINVDLHAVVNADFSFVIPDGAFMDPNGGDTLSYSVTLEDGSSLPSWLMFDAVEERLAGTPPSDQAGELRLKITAIDGGGLAASQDLSLQIWQADVIAGTGGTVNGTVASDIIVGMDQFDAIYASSGDDTVFAQGANDYISGGTGNDSLHAGSGNDYLIGGEGNDVLDGGSGNDSFAFTATSGDDVIIESGGIESLSIGPYGALDIFSADIRRNGDDLIIFTGPYSSITVRDSFKNTAHQVEWFSVEDEVTMPLEDLLQLVDQNRVNQSPRAGTAISDYSASAGEDLNISIPATAFIDFDGNNDISYSARLAGGATLPAWLDFSADNGLFSGKPANQDAGDYRIEVTVTDAGGLSTSQQFSLTVEPSGPEPINGTAGGDLLLGGGEADVLNGLDGEDVLLGAGGDDALDGGPGTDFLVGGGGDDRLLGGNDNDFLFAGNGNDVLNGDSANDLLSGGFGDDTYEITAGSGVDRIIDWSGNDLIEYLDAIGHDELWFSRAGDDLNIQVLGSGDRVKIGNWFNGQNQIETIRAGDGFTVVQTQVQQLVAAMAAFSPPAAGGVQLPSEVRQQLEPVFAETWQSAS
jgi:Ca2+-binding RTX toxin-like protein